MLTALAEEKSTIHGFLEAADTLATVAAFRAMGVSIERCDQGKLTIDGVGLHGLQSPCIPLNCGNSGTTMRLMAGILAGQKFYSRLIGDASLSRRPMRRVAEPLQRMGAKIHLAEGDCPPMQIYGGQTLHSIDYTLPVASAQVKSALMLAGLYARGITCIQEPQPTRDYTERMLKAFGWPVDIFSNRIAIEGGKKLQSGEIYIPGDFSSAAFFIVAAILIPNSELVLRQVGINPRRTGLLVALKMMGADIQLENLRELSGEAVADVRVRHVPLHGIELPIELVPDMIDEFPIFFVAAAVAQGQTRISGAAELRVKESDRIAVMATGLRTLGINIHEIADGAIIEGGKLHGGHVESGGDHRCAMSFAVGGQIAESTVVIADCENVATSFPGFLQKAIECGFNLREMIV